MPYVVSIIAIETVFVIASINPVIAYGDDVCHDAYRSCESFCNKTDHPHECHHGCGWGKYYCINFHDMGQHGINVVCKSYCNENNDTSRAACEAGCGIYAGYLPATDPAPEETDPQK